MYGQNFDYRTPGASLPPLYPGPIQGQQQQPYQMNQWGAAMGQMPAGMPGQVQKAHFLSLQLKRLDKSY